MKSLSLLPIFLLTWCATVVVAQADLVTQVLADTPKCAVPCLLEAFTSGGCSIDSIAPCVCTNITLQATLSVCAQTSCSFEDQLQAVAVEASLCAGYPQESRSNELKLTAIVLSAVVFPFVLLRFMARIYITRKLWMDDYIILAAALALAAIAGIEIASSGMGFGKHYWQINPANGPMLLKLFWVLQMLYISVQVFAKIAILLLLSRVFPGPRFQLIVKLASALLILHGVIFFFIDAFQCVPVVSIWDLTVTAKRCVDITALGYTGAAFSIGEDVFLLLLPIPWLFKLQMNRKKRIGVMALFGLGSFACLTSMIRLKYLVKFSRTFDSTWDNVDVVQWSVIEEFSALLCGSLPAVWPLVARFAPQFLGTGMKISDNPRVTDNSTSASSSRTKRRIQSRMTGTTEFGESDEELQHIPDKASDKERQSGEWPVALHADGDGVESDSIHHHKEPYGEP